MREVSVVIPNYNGIEYIKTCLDALQRQTYGMVPIVLVDNGSTDGSRELVETSYPQVKVIVFPENTGFCHAVNVGILETNSPYVILLNNDTEVAPDFVEKLLSGIKKRKKAFSCAAKMIQFRNRTLLDDAGNYYNAFGWAFARGKGKPVTLYEKPEKIFASCAGAAIYRRSVLDKIGLFDEEHFAYLEDIDIGYRARIYGYQNWYLPDAKVYHIGSGTSGSRYNLFKIRYSSRNNIYMIYKNMPFGQILLNFPFLFCGFLAKTLFFSRKGFGREYLAGMKNGISLANKAKKNGKKVKFCRKNLWNYTKIQIELWRNLIKRFQ